MTAAFDPRTTRYLEKNVVTGSDQVKFQEEGHFYWAFSKYYNTLISTDDGAGGLPLISATGVLGKYFKFDREGIALKIWNNPEKRHAMEYDVTNPYYGCKGVEDIIGKWSGGSEAGTKMHACFEDMANLVEYDKDHPPEQGAKLLQHLYVSEKLEGYTEKAYFYEFVKMFKIDDPASGMRFHRTELLMWHDVLHLTGTIDGLLYNAKDDSYVIIDWKRLKGGLQCDPKNPAKPVHMLAPSGRGQGLPAFECLRNNNGNKYGCQLALYKKMFEHMTGKRVSGMYLVVVDSKKLGKKGALKVHEVPLNKYDEAIRQAFEERARDMLARCEKTLDDEHMDKLIEILDEGDRIREEAADSGSSKRSRDESDDSDSDMEIKRTRTES